MYAVTMNETKIYVLFFIIFFVILCCTVY